MPGALHGLRVIDFGHYIAGPLAAVMLADQGADVIRVDPPDGPRWQTPADAFYSRGKRRITLDLKDAGDNATARRLIASADAVIENFRPGVMDRLGLGAEAMTAANPRLVYCSIPGFGKDDPRAAMQAWEGVIDAATENCKPRAGEPPPEWDSTRPTYSAVPLASNFGAFLGATAIVMALIARERTGRGQRIEVPLFDAMFTLIGHGGAYLESRGLRDPAGIHGRGAGCFRCGDGRYVQFDTSSARHLTWFAHAAGIDGWGELLDIVRLRDPAVNQELHARLRELFLTRPAHEWEKLGNDAGAAIGMVRTVEEWLHTGHARAIDAVTELDDPELGPTTMAGLPVQLSATPGAPGHARHLPDADRTSVLAELDSLAQLAPRRPPGEGRSEGSLDNPLQGLRALDLCVALAGPTSGRLLLEFGADVTKINAPHAGVGGYLNRGKRSLLLDVDSVEGRQVFWRLIENTDVIVQNFAPGTAERLGIGYEQVRARKPDIVYVSVSCYGRDGPWTAGRGWERQGQAVTGIMERCASIPAILGPYNLVDIGTGVLTTFGAALALYHRQRTGEGQHVSASLVQTGTYHQTPYMLDYKGHVATEPRGYEALGTGPLDRFYQASDAWFFLAGRDAASLRNVEGLEDVDLKSPQLEADLETRFGQSTAQSWVERLTAARISAHAVVPVKELMIDPDVRQRGLSVTQPVGEDIAVMPGLSIRLSDTPMRLGDCVHQPGSDAPAILAELDMADELSKLEKAWVLQASDLPPVW